MRAAIACQTLTEVAHFQKVVCGFCKNVTGLYVFFLSSIFLILFEIHCLGIQCTLMLSRHNVIQAFMNLGIVFSKHYELGIKKSRHNVI